MTNCNILKITAFGVALAFAPLEAFAQTASDSAMPSTTSSVATRTDDDHDGPDYGWVGLLGLLGLAGLMRKQHNDHAHSTTTIRNP